MITGNARREEIEASGNAILGKIESWANESKMKISVDKTKGILLKGKLLGRLPAIRLAIQGVQFVKQISYLGTVIDRGLTFLLHVKKAGDKACSQDVKISRYGKISRL